MIEGSKARPKLWMPEDLAEYLSVPVGWIYKRTRNNGPELIPHIKLGKYLRFDPESPAFQDWLGSHAAGRSDVTEDLTLPFQLNRVRAKEKTGQILTKGESVYGS
jgi:hypothetical protein